MAFVEWKSDYNVSVKIFNDDHKRLFGYLNELHDGLKAGLKVSDMSYILKGLIDYTVTHFQREEKLMIKYNYSKYKEHKEKHKALIDEVNSFYEDFQNGRKAFSFALLDFLLNWVSQHILKDDMEYKPFFTEIAQKQHEEALKQE